MRLDTSQYLGLEQQMKLSPRIIQAMEILQLPMLALQERIDAELQSNPVLELADAGVDPEAPLQREDTPGDRGEQTLVVDPSGDNSKDFERLAEFTDEFGMDSVTSDAPPPPRATAPGERDRKMEAMANAPAPEEPLDDYLLRQWAFVEAAPEVKKAGELIIGHIDEDGYLRVSTEELLERSRAPLTAGRVAEALKLVQTLDPAGVAARDLQECLLIQLRQEQAAGRDMTLEIALVSSFLRDIELNRLPQIARRLNKSVEDIKQALENLSHLNPHPGTLVGQRPAPVVTPDIIVALTEDGEVDVTMADGNNPRLYISKEYGKLARDRRAPKDVRQFLKTNVRSAEWLIAAIMQRRHTVQRVAEEVFAAQREFLTEGAEALKPLPMADVAQKVGVHVATVSRAVSGKYVQTPQGIHPLRMFFSGGTKTAGGADVAWDAVKARLKEVVDREDKSDPLNDDQIVEALTAEGIEIARRTVAKYRNALNIPPARKRKEF